MLAYLYCAAYIRMTMDEASPPCEKMRITFNDDGHDDLPVQAATNYTPITVWALLPPTYCRYQFTNSERMDSLAS